MIIYDEIFGNEIGIICDRCGTEILWKLRTDNFIIDYHCGYGTKYDGDKIEFQICDSCLVDIVKKEIPKAIMK